jgi:hypothetical protein
MTKSRRMRLADHGTHMEEMRNACNVLMGNPIGKRPLGRPRLRGEDNVKIDLKEIGRLWTGFMWLTIIIVMDS